MWEKMPTSAIDEVAVPALEQEQETRQKTT
jgi:hypothetical protein